MLNHPAYTLKSLIKMIGSLSREHSLAYQLGTRFPVCLPPANLRSVLEFFAVSKVNSIPLWGCNFFSSFLWEGSSSWDRCLVSSPTDTHKLLPSQGAATSPETQAPTHLGSPGSSQVQMKLYFLFCKASRLLFQGSVQYRSTASPLPR